MSPHPRTPHPASKPRTETDSRRRLQARGHLSDQHRSLLGRSQANNNQAQSSGLYDATKTNWRAYLGGDLASIQQKMSYLAGLGVTAVWISPPVDNLNMVREWR